MAGHSGRCGLTSVVVVGASGRGLMGASVDGLALVAVAGGSSSWLELP
jgi:hypothetical protein